MGLTNTKTESNNIDNIDNIDINNEEIDNVSEEVALEEEFDFTELDTYDVDQMVDYIKSIIVKRLDITDEFEKLTKPIQLDSLGLIQMCIEFYNKAKKVVPEYVAPKMEDGTPQKKYGKKMFFVKPKFTMDDVMKRIVTANTSDRLTVELNLDQIDKPKFAFKTDKITYVEFIDSFSDLETKRDMLGISKKMLAKLPVYHATRIINCYNSILNGLYDNKTCFGRGSFIYKESKKGPKDNMDSFREIVSIPTVISHFHRIMSLRMCDYLKKNNIINESIQKGALGGIKYGVLEQIYKVKEIIKHANTNKKTLCMAFLDVSNAFGSLDRGRLFEILRKYHFDENLISYIKTYYENFKYYAATKDWTTPLLNFPNGLVQGCPLSPILFVTALNYVLKHIDDKHAKEHGYTIDDTPVLFTAYMDDVCILAKDMKSLEIIYNKIKLFYECIGLKLNNSKSAIMRINSTDNIFDNVPLVNGYKYLGEYVSHNGSVYESFTDFMKLLSGKLFSIDKKRVTKDIKLGFFAKCMIPWVQRKMMVMYDITQEDRLKVISLLKKYMQKWGNIDSMKIFTFMSDIISSSNDEVITKLGFDKIFDDNLMTNIDLSNCIMNDISIDFSYGSLKTPKKTDDLKNADNDVDTELAKLK